MREILLGIGLSCKNINLQLDLNTDVGRFLSSLVLAHALGFTCSSYMLRNGKKKNNTA